MNIKEAKQEIENTLKAYLLKDENETYQIPEIRQRPVLLMGPPGIGKTAIVEQVARENQVGFVSYTITHHTRQSAIGLPMIERRRFGEKEYGVTEYTMSEIIGSVYEKMEETGLKEGILFIDEINCVSETLAPTMLQFLQGKTFGNHKVPSGWIIVAAGNPPEYNKSVREFDIVTLDRVKRINIEESFTVWKEYAYKHKIHESILSYLEIKKHNFYQVETTVEGKSFVTARGWEDLSELIYAYEKLGLPVTSRVVEEYLQHEKIAREFGNYLVLYYKYEREYGIEGIVKGEIPAGVLERVEKAPFDERFSVVGLLLGRLNESFQKSYEVDLFIEELFEALRKYKVHYEQKNEKSETSDRDLKLKIDKKNYGLEPLIKEYEDTYKKKKAGGLLDKKTDLAMRKCIDTLFDYNHYLMEHGPADGEEGFLLLKGKFEVEVENREQEIQMVSRELENTFSFLEKAFGQSQEMMLFLSELTMNDYSMKFISQNGSDAYYKYNSVLLLHDTHERLLTEINDLLD